MISVNDSIGYLDWFSQGPEKSGVLIYFEKSRKFDFIELENLLNERQTILSQKFSFLFSWNLSPQFYGQIVAVKVKNLEKRCPGSKIMFQFTRL